MNSYIFKLYRGWCRNCESIKFDELFTLGRQAIIKFKKSPQEQDEYVELALLRCQECGLVQLDRSVNPDRMFRDYSYKSGINQSMKDALKCVVVDAMDHIYSLDKGDVVIDIGSNDGTLLQNYTTDIVKIGFEPATNFAVYYENTDIHLIQDYFNVRAIRKCITKYAGDKRPARKAKIITAIAMFYDLDDPNQFCRDVKKILDPDGVFVLQLNDLNSMLQNNTIDNISHEHLCYYTPNTLTNILNKNGLAVVDLIYNDVNGGSMRVMAKHMAPPPIIDHRYPPVADPDPSAEEIRSWYQGLHSGMHLYLCTSIRGAKEQGKTIWGYGASTRGNTLLQWLNLDYRVIDKIADRNPDKWGKFTAGGNIPITSEEEMRTEHPDYLLILPYHFRKEFIAREKEYLEKGGKMIFPLPKPEVYPDGVS